MSEPKACPCGGQVYVGELKFTGETQWCVGCLHCNRGSGKHAEKAAAIAAWNAYVFSVVGKAQRPEGSAQREARSEHIPTPEGQGGGEREHLEWALDEIDTLSNMLVQFAYPQGAALVGRSEQAKRYVTARQHARALLSSPRVEEVRLREALNEAIDYVRDSIAYWPVGSLEHEVAEAVLSRCNAALATERKE